MAMFDDNSYRTIAWVVAALSMIGNAFICISCHLCETLSRDGVYNLIYWESLSALFYSFAFLLGRPINGSANCTVQALMFQYFGLASMLSIFLILYHMNNLIKRENVQVASLDVQRRYTFKITWKSYILVWVSPLLLMVVPFATDSYGQADIGNRKRSICWIRLEKWTDLYVMLCVYYIPLVIIFIFCMYHVITIVWRTWRYGHHTVTSYIRRLTLYPIIFFVCSIPGVYMRADVAINPEKEYEIWFKCLFAGFLAAQGLFSSLLFGSTPVVLRFWKDFRFEWFINSYIPRICSRFKISERPDNDEHDSNNIDEMFTAAGL